MDSNGNIDIHGEGNNANAEKDQYTRWRQLEH